MTKYIINRTMLSTFIKKSILKTITTSKHIHRFMAQPNQYHSQLLFLQKYKFSVQNILDPNSLANNELKMYQSFLIKHNKSIKTRVHPKLIGEQERIISAYLASNKLMQILNFLKNNCSRRLSSVNTAKNIDAWIVQNWQKISQFEKMQFSFFLSLFQEFNSFNKFKANFLAKNATKLKDYQINELVCVIYGSLIQSKSIENSISFIFSLQKKEKYSDLLAYLRLNHCKIQLNEFRKQLIYLFQLYLSSNHSIYQTQNQLKRSLLEADVQCFLAALGYKNIRQVFVNGYKIDFIVQNSNQSKKYLLEINGSYHYTATGKIKGRQIIRNLIVNLYSPLRILHVEDYNKTQGHHNKRKFIQSLFQMTDVNWDAKEKGFNSEWQLAEEYKQLQ